VRFVFVYNVCVLFPCKCVFVWCVNVRLCVCVLCVLFVCCMFVFGVCKCVFVSFVCCVCVFV